MGALMGFVVGYVMGTKAGRRGLAEVTGAWDEIRRSEEFRALLAGAGETARQVLGRVAAQGRGTLGPLLAEQARQVLDRRTARAA